MGRTILVKGPWGRSDPLLRSMIATESLGRPFEFRVEILTKDVAVPLEELLGRAMRVEMPIRSGSRYFHGCVSSAAQTGMVGDYCAYQVELVPWLWFLSQASDSRIFQNISVPDVIQTVFRDHGFSDFEDALSRSYPKQEYCVQYQETDLDFVQRLMEREGIYYYFRHESSRHVLVLADEASAHSTESGYERIPYHPASQSIPPHEDCLQSWSTSRAVVTGKFSVTDYDFRKPRASLLAESAMDRGHAQGGLEVFLYPGRHLARSDGEQYARHRLDASQSGHERALGEGTSRGIMAGRLFELRGFPRADQNKEYLCVAATHQLVASGYESGSEVTESYRCSFVAQDSKQQFRLPQQTPMGRVRGPQTATVVGPNGEEIWTDEYGRIKVQFHWDRHGTSDENSSCWVRVAQVWAGNNWGMVAIPRIGQEVVVDFLEGDPDQPLVTGRVYNEDNRPPYELPANRTQSGIKSRSSKEGTPENFNEIRFEDKKGSEQLYIHAERNQDNVVENDQTTDVRHDRTETVGNDETITIGNNRNENVGADQSITIGRSRTERVAESESIGVGKGQSLTVGKNQTLSVGENRSADVGKDETLRVGRNHNVTVGDRRTTSVEKDDALSVGKNLVIQAGDSVSIKTGSASITMKKDGTITIKGKDITLNGSGKINIRASGDVTIKGSKVNQN
jgi:type VI secretion system secreted protein VgrG